MYSQNKKKIVILTLYDSESIYKCFLYVGNNIMLMARRKNRLTARAQYST